MTRADVRRRRGAQSGADQAEQVAAFGYGTLGPRLRRPDVDAGPSCEQAHQRSGAGRGPRC